MLKAKEVELIEGEGSTEERMNREASEQKVHFNRQHQNYPSAYLHLSAFPFETVALFLTLSWFSSSSIKRNISNTKQGDQNK